jgi:ribosomal protein S18 acetylase RimI-like enzyme
MALMKRIARYNDEREMARLSHDLSKTYMGTDTMHEFMKKCCDDFAVVAFMEETPKHLVGYLLMRHQSKGKYYAYNIGTDKTIQKQGIAKKMFQFAMNHMAHVCDEGPLVIVGDIRVGNVASRAMFKSLGGRELSTHHNHYGSGGPGGGPEDGIGVILDVVF